MACKSEELGGLRCTDIKLKLQTELDIAFGSVKAIAYVILGEVTPADLLTRSTNQWQNDKFNKRQTS
jgi:hypothetical protein